MTTWRDIYLGVAVGLLIGFAAFGVITCAYITLQLLVLP